MTKGFYQQPHSGYLSKKMNKKKIRYKKSDEFHRSFIFIKMYYVYILYSVSVDN